MNTIKNILLNGFVLKMNNELNDNPTEEKLLHLIKCINEVKNKYPEKSSYLDNEFNEKLSKCYDNLKSKDYDEYEKYCRKYFRINPKSLRNVSIKELNVIIYDGKNIDSLNRYLTELKVKLADIFYIEEINLKASEPYLKVIEKSIEDLNDFEIVKVNVIKSKMLDIELQIEKIIHNRLKEL